MPKALDLTGCRFGRLVAVEQDGFVIAGREKKRAWLCRCDCGAEIRLPTGALRSGNTSSCGCLHREIIGAMNRRHGASHGKDGSRTYSAWSAMKARCNNPKHIGYENYGGRGIKVYPEWDASYEAFERDMGKCPSGYTIERLDADKDYQPNNCEWLPREKQNLNKRNSARVQYRGQTMLLADACRLSGVSLGSVYVMASRERQPHQAVFDRLLARRCGNDPAISAAA